METLKAVLPLMGGSADDNAEERMGLARKRDVRAEEAHQIAIQREARAQQAALDAEHQRKIANANRVLADLKKQREEKETLLKTEEQALINLELMHINPSAPDAKDRLLELQIRYPAGMSVPATHGLVANEMGQADKVQTHLQERYQNYGVDPAKFVIKGPSGDFAGYNFPAMEAAAAPARQREALAKLNASRNVAERIGASTVTAPTDLGSYTMRIAEHQDRIADLMKVHDFTDDDLKAINVMKAASVAEAKRKMFVPDSELSQQEIAQKKQMKAADDQTLGVMLTNIEKDAEYQFMVALISASAKKAREETNAKVEKSLEMRERSAAERTLRLKESSKLKERDAADDKTKKRIDAELEVIRKEIQALKPAGEVSTPFGLPQPGTAPQQPNAPKPGTFDWSKFKSGGGTAPTTPTAQAAPKTQASTKFDSIAPPLGKPAPAAPTTPTEAAAPAPASSAAPTPDITTLKSALDGWSKTARNVESPDWDARKAEFDSIASQFGIAPDVADQMTLHAAQGTPVSVVSHEGVTYPAANIDGEWTLLEPGTGEEPDDEEPDDDEDDSTSDMEPASTSAEPASAKDAYR